MRAYAELAALTEALGSAHQNLLTRARTLGREAGIEVLDLRPAGDNLWELRFRIAAAAPDRNPEDSWIAAASPATAVVSPIRTVTPFSGDGTVDIARFVAEADPRAAVAPNGDGSGEFPTFSGRRRLEMLANAVIGDALLSVQHAGGDDADCAEALRMAREHFGEEISRFGAADERQELLTLFDRAAVTLAPLLRHDEV